MRTQFSKLALSAAVMLALVFTFGCSSGGGDSFNENLQIYNEDGTLYKGSGVIEILAYDEEGYNEIAGSVTNGIVKLELPKTIPDEYLSVFFLDKLASLCTDYTEGIKEFNGLFVLTDNNGNHLGELAIL